MGSIGSRRARHAGSLKVAMEEEKQVQRVVGPPVSGKNPRESRGKLESEAGD
jgi:hypothetical protein